jgi:hypothetical protein
MVFRCASCLKVLFSPNSDPHCDCGGDRAGEPRRLTEREVADYIRVGHAAFPDLAPVTDGNGSILGYTRREN